MKTYFIVAQADTDSEGYLKNSTILCDKDGNTELYVSAEEARESIAREVAKYADVMSSLSFNDSLVPIDLDAACESWYKSRQIYLLPIRDSKLRTIEQALCKYKHQV